MKHVPIADATFDESEAPTARFIAVAAAPPRTPPWRVALSSALALLVLGALWLGACLAFIRCVSYLIGLFR